eukprot:2534976-Rhodomonas_salina.1
MTSDCWSQPQCCHVLCVSSVMSHGECPRAGYLWQVNSSWHTPSLPVPVELTQADLYDRWPRPRRARPGGHGLIPVVDSEYRPAGICKYRDPQCQCADSGVL